MNFAIIPFFLVSEIVTNGNWIHGPEYTFDVNIDLSTSGLRPALTGNTIRFSMLMKCRPKEPAHLICHFEKTQMSPHDPRIMSELVFINEVVFQVNYNSWANPSNITMGILPTDFALNIIKFIVEGLNIDLDTQVDHSFFFDELRGTSAYGRCLTEVVIKPTKSFDEEVENHFGKLLVPSFKTRSPGEKIIIQKSRTPSRCDRRTHYFFTSNDESLDLHAAVTSVKSTIVISNTYESNVETEGFAFTLGSIKRTLIHQNSNLRLIRVAPAKEPLIKSPKGLMFSPFIYDHLVISGNDNDMYVYHIHE